MLNPTEPSVTLVELEQQEQEHGILLIGQPIALSHAGTTAAQGIGAGNGTGSRSGTTVWSAHVMGHRVWFSWDWVEVMPEVLMLADPMGISTNAVFYACDGKALDHAAIVLELNRIVYFLPWQQAALSALLWEEKNKRPPVVQKPARDAGSAKPQGRAHKVRKPLARRRRTFVHRNQKLVKIPPFNRQKDV